MSKVLSALLLCENDRNHPVLSQVGSTNTALQRGNWSFEKKKERTSWGTKTHIFDIMPNDIPKHWASHDRYGDGRRITRYDPQHAHVNEDGFVTPHSKGDEITKEPGLIYRGMNHEEYHQALHRGHFQSEGSHNIGKAQEGLTYFSSDPHQAESYAHGFAPWQHKATPSRPAVIVAVKDPGGHVVHPDRPTELGIRGQVPTSSIHHIYTGHPIITSPGSIDIHEDHTGVHEGSRSSPSISVRWKREDK